MSLWHRTVKRLAAGFAVPLADGCTLNRDLFEVHTLIVALFVRLVPTWSERALTCLRAELRGLGADLALISRQGVFCAVYHATGKRVRDLPITLDKVPVTT